MCNLYTYVITVIYRYPWYPHCVHTRPFTTATLPLVPPLCPHLSLYYCHSTPGTPTVSTPVPLLLPLYPWYSHCVHTRPFTTATLPLVPPLCPHPSLYYCHSTPGTPTVSTPVPLLLPLYPWYPHCVHTRPFTTATLVSCRFVLCVQLVPLESPIW